MPTSVPSIACVDRDGQTKLVIPRGEYGSLCVSLTVNTNLKSIRKTSRAADGTSKSQLDGGGLHRPNDLDMVNINTMSNIIS